jgi:hypothetical protein
MPFALCFMLVAGFVLDPINRLGQNAFVNRRMEFLVLPLGWRRWRFVQRRHHG